jgi:hypothetical protein
MAIVINSHGNSILEIEDSTKTESVFLNFDDIVLRSFGDFVGISQKKVIQEGVEEIKIDFNDVVTPSGATDGKSLLRLICQLF